MSERPYESRADYEANHPGTVLEFLFVLALVVLSCAGIVLTLIAL